MKPFNSNKQEITLRIHNKRKNKLVDLRVILNATLVLDLITQFFFKNN